MTAVSLQWGPRWPPLDAEFVVGRGFAGRHLARAVLATPTRLAGLRGVLSPDVLALTGADLPWVDGVEYFGREEGAPWLLMPTTRECSVRAAWLEHRFRATSGAIDWPCLLLGETELELLPVGRVGALEFAQLERWCARD